MQKINEDGVIVDPYMGLFGIIDAFGGVGIGDEFVKFLKQEIPKGISYNQSDPDRTLNFYFDPLRPIEVNAIYNLIFEINKKSIELNQKKNYFQRAAASLCLGLQVGDILHLISVGCVGAYLVRNGSWIEVVNSSCFTTMPSELPERLRTGGLVQTGIPKTAIGLNLNLELQWSPVNLLKGDLLVLSTDGVIWDDESRQFLASIAAQANSTHSLQKMVEKAFDQANARGNADNQTMLLLEY
jgi:serine/threonine protein phosphatase PrpC